MSDGRDSHSSGPTASCAAAPLVPEEALRDVFGHSSFRPGQREVVEAVCRGRDALAIMPTGAGKSVTFQLPARLGAGPVLVVSPLVALMRDQVAGAVRRGLRATWIEAGLPAEERARRVAGLSDGSVEILYVSPEALQGLARTGAPRVGLLAVDEAHCISQWGHDFRPPYRLIAETRDRLGGPTTLAVTATATPAVADDIRVNLGLRDPLVWRGTFLRPNLRLATFKKDALTDSDRVILAAVRAHDGEDGIVYCLSRRRAGALASTLCARGVTAAPYHAGMEGPLRSEIQDAFAAGEVSVVVATVAFGMGIDKPDVRFVVHADLPSGVEAYAQEIGRAGRDGLPSDCLMLYSAGDVSRRIRLSRGLEPDRRRDVRRRLSDVLRFASGPGCLHVRLCAYFGEAVAACRCGCDRCGGPDAGAMTERPRHRVRW